MLWTRRATDAALFGVMGALTLAAGCGTAGGPRHTLPDDERGLLELTPDDAFMGARLDLRAARAMPHWAELETWLTKYSGEDWAEWLDGTDRVVLLVGGLVTAPAFPMPDPEAEQAPAPPAWVRLARVLGGALPRAVLVVEGSAAELCSAALEGHSGREVRGYRVGVTNGVALMVRERECLLTYEPVVDSLLNQPPGPPSRIASQLAGRTEEGAPSIFRYGIDHDDPGFVALMEQGSMGADRELERQRERRREREARLAEGGETDPENSEFLMSITMNFELALAQWTKFCWEFGEVTLRGLSGSEGYLVHADGGYAFRQRVRFDHAGRAAMTREVLRVALELYERTVTTFDLPEGVREAQLAMLRGVEITDQSDGYDLRAGWSDQAVNAFMALSNEPEDEWVPPESDEDDVDGLAGIVEQWEQAMGAPAADAIPLLEALQQRLLVEPGHYYRVMVRVSLAAAYSFVGRYDDAVAFLRGEIEREVANGYDTPDMNWPLCRTAAELCEVHLRQGHARLALEAADTVIEGGSSCADVDYDTFACQQVARAQTGALDQALEAAEVRIPHVEDDDYIDTLPFAMLRVRILQAGGRGEEANQVLLATCPRPLLGEACLDWFDVQLSVAADAGEGLERWDAQLVEARVAYPGGAALGIFANRVAAAIQIANCERRARVAPRDAATLSACEAAKAFVDGQHGPTHVSAADVRIPLLTVYRAQRRTADATRVSDELDALRSRLGPQHPVNASAAARPARPASRPPR